MRILDLFLPEPPINNILDQQLLLNRMIEAETHSAYDTDRHCLFILSLLCTDVAFHDITSNEVPMDNKNLQKIYHIWDKNANRFSFGRKKRRKE